MKLGRVPQSPLNSIINRRSNPYTLYEEGGSGNDSWNDTPTLSSIGVTVEIDVHGRQSSPQSYPTGEQWETSLRGLMTTAEHTDDVENGLCIAHSGDVYEITIDGWPDDQNPTVYTLTLEERTDLTPP